MKKIFSQQLMDTAVFCTRMVVLISLITSQFFGAARPVSALPDPFFSVRFTEKEVHGYGWTLGSTVTVSIDDPDVGDQDYAAHNETVEEANWNPSDTLVVFTLDDQPGFELQPGQIVTMTDGTTTKTHTVVSDLSITGIDFDTDTITGTVEGESTVIVQANCDDGCASKSVTASSGIWAADFSGIGVEDIHPGSSCGALVEDADRDNTGVSCPIYDYSPLNVGFIQTGSEGGWREANTNSFINTADDLGITLDIYIANNNVANQHTAFQGFIDDPNVNVIVLAALEPDGWDTLLTNAKNEDKKVIISDRPVSAPNTLYDAYVGSDFVEEGRKAGTEMCILLTGSPSKNVVELVGELGSAPAVDRAAGFRQTAGGCGITITQTETANWSRYQGRQVMEGFLQTSTNIQGLYAHNDEMAFGAIDAIRDASLDPGDDIKIVSVDAIGEAFRAMIRGDLNATVECSPNIAPQVYEAARRALNNDATLPKRIPSIEGVFRRANAATDYPTRYDYNPTFSARFPENEVHGYGWYPIGASITVNIDDPGIPGAVNHTDTQQVVVADWDPNETFVRFALGGFELQPGQIITMTGGPKTKTHTVTDLAVTNVNPVADTISGTADTGSVIEIGWICDGNGNDCAFRRVTSVNGNWLANFHVVGEDDDEQVTFNIVPGTGNEARQPDDDWDNTSVQWRVPKPRIEVRANDDNLNAIEWPMGTLLNLSINNPATGASSDYSASKTVTETTPWGSGETLATFETGAFDIKPGFIVSVSGGGTTRTYTVTGLEITAFDLASDVVSGKAAPNSEVEIWACWDNGCTDNRQETADGSGNWSTDFTGMHDIEEGTWVDSAQWDANDNGTMFGQNAFDPNYTIIASPDFSANFTANQLRGYGWPLGATVNLTIDDPDGPDYGPAQATVGGSIIGHTTLLFNLGVFDLKPGQVVTMTDGTHTETHTLTNLSELSVGFIQVGTQTDGWWRDTNTASFVDTANQQGLPLKYYFGQYQQMNQFWAFDQFIQDPDVNVIVLSAAATQGWGTRLVAAQAAGKKVVLSDRAISASNTLYTTLITFDFVEEGRKAGTEMCALLAGSLSRNVVELVGAPSEPATDRAAGFRQTAGGCGITITQSEVANWSYDEGRQVMEDFLQASTNIQGVFAHNDQMGLGAIQAIKDDAGFVPGDDIKIVSIDSEPDAITALNTGELNATVECNPRLAPASYNAALQALKGQTVPKTIFVEDSVHRETVHPSVSSIVRAFATNPTSASSVNFTVSFSEDVKNVDVVGPLFDDFALTTDPDTSDASVKSVLGSGKTYTVTVNTGRGDGDIRLDMPGTATINDLAGNSLDGLPYSGETYTVRNIDAAFTSVAANDGWTLESSEYSSRANARNNSGSLLVGDNIKNKQYRSLLYFDTASLPNNAVISSITVKIMKEGVTGMDPFTTHGVLLADMAKGFFGKSSALENLDFQAKGAPRFNVGSFTPVSGDWYQLVLSPANFKFINLNGATQFRMRFAKDDDNDKVADYISFYSGADGANSPQIIVEYKTP